MARLMKRHNKGDVFFCVVRRHYDATTQSFNDKELLAEIAQIKTDQSNDFTKKLQHIITKHKVICKPLDSLPPHRPGLDHEIELSNDFEYPNSKLYKLSQAELEELKNN